MLNQELRSVKMQGSARVHDVTVSFNLNANHAALLSYFIVSVRDFTEFFLYFGAKIQPGPSPKTFTRLRKGSHYMYMYTYSME